MKRTPEQRYPGMDLSSAAISAPIEPAVRALCEELNSKLGVYTLWSCEGHPEIATRPYVTFLAPRTFAFKVHQRLGQARQQSRLHFCWWVVATFRQDGALQFTIEPNDFRVSEGTWTRWWSRYRWSKDLMDRDLEELANLVRAIEESGNG